MRQGEKMDRTNAKGKKKEKKSTELKGNSLYRKIKSAQ